MNKKVILLIKISFLFFLIFYFRKFIKTEEFLNAFKMIEVKDMALILFLYFTFFILVTLRWMTVVSNFVKLNFFYLFKNIILGYNIAIFTSTLAVDATKFYGLSKKIESSKNISLVIYDKLFTLFFKIIFLFIIFNYLNFTKLEIYENTFFLISSAIAISLIFFSIRINFFLKYLLRFKFFSFLKNIEKTIKINKNKIKKLIFLNLVIQFQFILMYFVVIKIFIKNISFIEVSLITPLIEIVGILQILFIGIIEFSTVMFYSILNFSNESILAATLTLRFNELLITVPVYLFSIYKYKSDKNRQL